MYPRIVKLDNQKLKGLIENKNELVLSGRKVDTEINLIKDAQKAVEKKLIEAEGKIDIADLTAKSLAIRDQMVEKLKEADEIQKQIYQKIKDNTPQELRDQYDQLEKQKSDKETELNKIGHKVQKVKDKIIPLVQKLGKPHLEEEWEDFNTTKLDKDGTPILEIYSRLEEWKATQRNK